MDDSTTPDDDEQNIGELTNAETSAPAVELDFGIGRLYLKGDADTSFAELMEEFNAQKDEMNDTIKMLKEYDYELKEEYSGEGSRASSSKTFG